jgi:hypothetical protein
MRFTLRALAGKQCSNFTTQKRKRVMLLDEVRLLSYTFPHVLSSFVVFTLDVSE